MTARRSSGAGPAVGAGSGRGRAARSSLIARLPPRLEPEASFVFSPDRGLLNLSPHTRDELHVAMATIEIHAASDCMGAEVSRWLMESVAGYDIAVLNAVIAATGGRGVDGVDAQAAEREQRKGEARKGISWGHALVFRVWGGGVETKCGG